MANLDAADYVQWDGLEVARRIRAGDVSVDEVLACARRLARERNPQINAIIELFDTPLEASDDPDAPFHGVPFVIKDLVCHAAGVKHEFGSRLAAGAVFPHDTDLMSRFRCAGLRTIARTATPEFGYCANTAPLVNGPTRNPWDLDRMPGGSSGASAAAVAAGIVPVAHANDGGGSIRIPAHCCGLVGLKPTRGRTPIGPDAAEGLNGLGIEFAVTRTVRDCAALLDAVQGPGVGDPYEIAPPPESYLGSLARPPAPLRVAFSTAAWSGVPVDPAMAEAVETTARCLEDLGHEVQEARPEFDWEHFLDALHVVWVANTAALVDQVAAYVGRTPGPDNLEATTWACYRDGKMGSAPHFLNALHAFNAVSRVCGAFLQRYDVFMTPTCTAAALPVGAIDANDSSVDARGWTRVLFDFAAFTPAFNVTGQPAISLPLHRTAQGLPLGIQFAAPFGKEDTLLRLAAQLEQALPWPTVSGLA